MNLTLRWPTRSELRPWLLAAGFAALVGLWESTGMPGYFSPHWMIENSLLALIFLWVVWPRWEFLPMMAAIEDYAGQLFRGLLTGEYPWWAPDPWWHNYILPFGTEWYFISIAATVGLSVINKWWRNSKQED